MKTVCRWLSVLILSGLFSSMAWGESAFRMNQVGYLPDAPKRFEIPVQSGVTDSFQVVNAANEVVWKGSLGTSFSVAEDGESVRRGDFSAFADTGTFRLRTGSFYSPYFAISTHVFDALYRDAVLALRRIRANDSLVDTVLGIRHGLAHQQDSALDGKDLRGGWYNAGDYGKWTHEAAYTVADMLWLHTLRPELSEKTGLLPEVKWGLAWLFRMQEDDGTVLHKVDTEGCWGWGKAPEKDTCTRQASFQEKGNMTPSTMDAADFAGVMARASRIFRESETAIAVQCSTAAVHSWEWVKEHPSAGQADPYYTDASMDGEFLQAAGEIYALNGDSAALSLFREHFASHAFSAPTWMTPELFGYEAVLSSASAPSSLKDSVENAVVAAAENFLALAEESGHEQAIPAGGYYWGSNAATLGRGQVLAYAYELTGMEKYRDGALAQLNYVLGRNGLGFSMVTGYGAYTTVHPYHWIYKVYKVIMPGWLSGGPNSYISGADSYLAALINAGTPEGKCFLDDVRSYASNEGATDQNAPLLFLSGFFSDSSFEPLAIPVKRARPFLKTREPLRYFNVQGEESPAFHVHGDGSRSPVFGH